MVVICQLNAAQVNVARKIITNIPFVWNQHANNLVKHVSSTLNAVLDLHVITEEDVEDVFNKYVDNRTILICGKNEMKVSKLFCF